MPATSVIAASPLRPRGRETFFAIFFGALIVAAWLALWYWSAGPYRRYVGHASLLEPGALLAFCRALPQGEIVVPALLHALGWVLMIAAMMLPTTYPLLGMFRNVARGRADANRLTPLAVARSVPYRTGPRRVLRRLLLGVDAVHVRRRHREHWLDAGVGCADGGREKSRPRRTLATSSGTRSAGDSERDHTRANLTPR